MPNSPTLERPGRLVEVTWVDSAGRSDWHDPDDARDLLSKMQCRSAGYLVEETDEGIVIAQGAGSLGQWLSSMAIPRVAVIGIEELRDAE